MSALPTPPYPTPPDNSPGAGGEYEYRELTVPRGMSRSELNRVLTDHAEYGHWELARVRLSAGGRRRVWLRRRIIRVVRTG
ncbi:MAG: DUF5703 family protein [Kineosporiaceae bacterium]